ncbi:MAG: coiled-coil domain-containing protein, partial [Turicibacter sp.]
MLKKTIIQTLIAITVVTLSVVPTSKSLIANATTTCTTAAECDALINDAKDTISGIKDQENQVQGELKEVENSIGATLDKISSTEKAISDFQNKIVSKENEIVQTENEIKLLEDDIAALKEVVGQRMRISQRFSKTNMFLEVLSESSSIVDLVRRLQVVNHFAESDS